MDHGRPAADGASRREVVYRPHQTSDLTPTEVVLGVTAAGITVAVVAVHAAQRVAGPVLRLLYEPPLVPRQLQPRQWLAPVADRAVVQHRLAQAEFARMMDELIPLVAAQVLGRIDLTALVLERVDLDTIVAAVDINAAAGRLDVNAVAGTVDIDAIIDRVDLVGLAEEVINAIDLPEIIRDSTGAVASETVRGARMRGIAADQAISRTMGRLLQRRTSPTTGTDSS